MATSRTNLSSIVAGITFSAMIALAAGCAGSAGTAEAPAVPGGGGSDAAALYVGEWEGSFDVSMADGDLQVTLSYDGTEWTGQGTLSAMGESMSGAIENFQITEDGCSFSFFIEMADIFLSGILEEGLLAGIIEVFAESELVAEGTFSLKKKLD